MTQDATVHVAAPATGDMAVGIFLDTAHRRDLGWFINSVSKRLAIQLAAKDTHAVRHIKIVKSLEIWLGRGGCLNRQSYTSHGSVRVMDQCAGRSYECNARVNRRSCACTHQVAPRSPYSV